MSEQTGSPGEEHGPEVGSVAEETAKLLGALSGWAKEHGADVGAGLGAGLGGAFHDASQHVANGDDCKYCPFCRVVHIVRESSPEVRTHLAVAAASIAQAASAVLQAAVADEGKAGEKPGQHRRDPVEKIDLDDDFGPFEGPFG